MSKQYKNIPVGTIFTRPSIGTQVIYKKISDETNTAPGKSEIIDVLEDQTPSMIGQIVTSNRSHVVHTHEQNPLTEQDKINAAEWRNRVRNNRRGLGFGRCA